jgi:hypothetical protein
VHEQIQPTLFKDYSSPISALISEFSANRDDLFIFNFFIWSWTSRMSCGALDMAAWIPMDPSIPRNWLGLKIDKPIASLNPSVKGKVICSTCHWYMTIVEQQIEIQFGIDRGRSSLSWITLSRRPILSVSKIFSLKSRGPQW